MKDILISIKIARFMSIGRSITSYLKSLYYRNATAP